MFIFICTIKTTNYSTYVQIMFYSTTYGDKSKKVLQVFDIHLIINRKKYISQQYKLIDKKDFKNVKK